MRLITAVEAAKLLNLSKQRVYELIRQNVLPAVRLGPRQVRIEESALRDWIERGGSSMPGAA